MTDKRIAVLGAGANGAAFGADMINGGVDVVLIDQWPAHVEAMRANGLRV
ncbi:MAG: 2-dehydropantoate 2-reductase N-terminal domain-containing protein, partial [Alphaproteobacteria bacterium]